MQRYFSIALLVVLLVLHAGLIQAKGLRHQARWIPDGDTLQLDNGQWVRLQGIDAPETAHDGRPAQLHARESATALRRLAQGRELAIEVHGKDRYGRLLGTCRLADGTDLALEQVRAGNAFYYFHADHTQALRDRLLAAQREAMERGRGFWPAIQDLARDSGPWVGNERSRRAFPEGSPKADSVSPVNRVPFADLWQVFANGFCTAGAVSPWPVAGP